MTKYEIVCSECKGEGRIQNEEWQEYFRKENELKEKFISEGIDEINAERKAWEEMWHLHPDEPEEYCCGECDGRGTIPTKEGLELLIFIRKYIRG